jgi:hypothetical protein
MHDCELPMSHAQLVATVLPSSKPSMHIAAVTEDRPAFKPLWLWWVLLSALFALQACNASPEGPPTEPEPRARPTNAEALDHFDRGNRLFRVHEFEQAIEEYKAGVLIEDVPLFHFNLGQSYRKAGQYEKALWHFDLFARHVPTSDPNRPIIEGIIEKTKSERLSASAPPVEQTASVDASTAAVEKAGADAVADRARPSPISPTRNNVVSSLRRAPQLRSTEPAGELAILVTPWAAVWLNGKSLTGGTPYRMKVPAGRHRLRIANEDLGRRETLTVTIKPNETTTIERVW